MIIRSLWKILICGLTGTKILENAIECALCWGFGSDRDYPHSEKTFPIEKDFYQTSFLPPCLHLFREFDYFQFNSVVCCYSGSEFIRRKEKILINLTLNNLTVINWKLVKLIFIMLVVIKLTMINLNFINLVVTSLTLTKLIVIS